MDSLLLTLLILAPIIGWVVRCILWKNNTHVLFATAVSGIALFYFATTAMKANMPYWAEVFGGERAFHSAIQINIPIHTVFWYSSVLIAAVVVNRFCHFFRMVYELFLSRQGSGLAG